MNNRREFITMLLVGAGIVTVLPRKLMANNTCNVTHPFMPAHSGFSGECHNCGMEREMWARTWHSSTSEGSAKEFCSIHCLAEAMSNAGLTPNHVKVALYHEPQKSIVAEDAFYVVGSKARGTMTMKSKIAFAAKQKAMSFVSECGGEVVPFRDAYAMAIASIYQENQMIRAKRVNKGKIVEPVDNKDICPVCDMYPARYPKNKCQLQLANGKVIHFCSTYCLFEFLKNHHLYGYSSDALTINFIWVVDFETEQWIYARNAYYVVGSKVTGPMGKEAFPFVNREKAELFASARSGSVERFREVTIEGILK